jgi:hypothetical protein
VAEPPLSLMDDRFLVKEQKGGGKPPQSKAALHAAT